MKIWASNYEQSLCYFIIKNAWYESINLAHYICKAQHRITEIYCYVATFVLMYHTTEAVATFRMIEISKDAMPLDLIEIDPDLSYRILHGRLISISGSSIMKMLWYGHTFRLSDRLWGDQSVTDWYFWFSVFSALIFVNLNKLLNK